MPLDQSTLAQFSGTESYHRWSPLLFRNVVLTDGAKYVADNGGKNGAYWLMDAIASYQIKARKNVRLRDAQFWTLTVKNGKGKLVCQADSGLKPVITQVFDYTDFDLSEIKLWVFPQPKEDGSVLSVILLPSEY